MTSRSVSLYLCRSVCVCIFIVCVGCIQVRSAFYAKEANDIYALMCDEASKVVLLPASNPPSLAFSPSPSPSLPPPPPSLSLSLSHAGGVYAHIHFGMCVQEDYGTALYWMGLNFGTLCRIGGGGTWTAERAHEIAGVCVCACVRVCTLVFNADTCWHNRQ
jgi:hypothetical protein